MPRCLLRCFSPVSHPRTLAVGEACFGGEHRFIICTSESKSFPLLLIVRRFYQNSAFLLASRDRRTIYWAPCELHSISASVRFFNCSWLFNELSSSASACLATSNIDWLPKFGDQIFIGPVPSSSPLVPVVDVVVGVVVALVVSSLCTFTRVCAHIITLAVE